MQSTMSLREILTLEPQGGDTFRGLGPAYPWGGLYGGQIVAQGLRAATLTAQAEQAPHSIHAYFIRSGTMEREVHYKVERLRDGRSFSTRRVLALQGDELIASMAASFQRPEESEDVQGLTAPAYPSHQTLPSESWSPLVERHLVSLEAAGRAAAWMKIAEPLDDDPALHAAAFAFLSDDLPTDALGTLHPERVVPGSGRWPFFNASLDHVVHFHVPARADELHLHDFTATRFTGARGLSRGELFGANGQHFASVAQELLLRPRR